MRNPRTLRGIKKVVTPGPKWVSYPNPARYLLYRVLEPLGPYIVGTCRVKAIPHKRCQYETTARFCFQDAPGGVC